MDANAVGQRIRGARTRAGFDSLRKFALQSGLPESYLSKYENGKHIPSAEHLLAIADACGVTTDWLLRGDEHPSNVTTPETPDEAA